MSPGGAIPCVNVRELAGKSTARSDKKLDDELGLASGMTTACTACGAATYPDTDGMGGALEICERCGHRRRISQFMAAAAPVPSTGRPTSVRRSISVLNTGVDSDRRPKRVSPERDPPRRRRPIADAFDVPAAAAVLLPPQLALTQRPMSSISKKTRKCQRSGREYTPRGNRQLFCGECPQCLKAAAPAAQPKAEKRKPADTGYRPAPPAAANGGGYSPAIAGLEAELESIDARREKVVSAIATLRALEPDAG